MNARVKAHYEKLLLALAGGALALSLIWCGYRKARETRPESRATKSPAANYQAVSFPAELPTEDWKSPVSQKAGAGWVYELFAPPTIGRDPSTGDLVVRVAESAGSRNSSSGLKLLSVCSAPYRVQLQGYFGHPGDYVAVLMVVGTRELWYARPGDQWIPQGVTLQRFDPATDTSETGDRAAGRDAIPRAVLWDAKTGAEIILEAGYLTLTDEPQAVVQLMNSSQTRELREGDSWVAGENTYRLDSLIKDPPQASVSQRSAEGQATRMLLLRAGTGEARDSNANMRPGPPHSPL